MNPYQIDIEKLKESLEIKDEKEILKIKLAAAFIKATSNMSSKEILSKTGLHKSDLSRIRTMSIKRFTIDKIISLLGDLGFSTNIQVKRKSVS